MDEELAEAIKNVCRSTPDLLKETYLQRDDRHPLEGHCYVASEAYFHAAGGYEAGYTVWRISHEGETHWFLKDPDGDVIDLTEEQFDAPVPHDDATKTGFLTSEPSARAQTVLEEINCCG